jgi:hypothetical protein
MVYVLITAFLALYLFLVFRKARWELPGPWRFLIKGRSMLVEAAEKVSQLLIAYRALLILKLSTETHRAQYKFPEIGSTWFQADNTGTISMPRPSIVFPVMLGRSSTSSHNMPSATSGLIDGM